MKKNLKKQFLAFMLLMVGFTAVMIFGVIYGPQYPQLFFWGIMSIFAVVFGILVAPTIKDFVILIIGMVALAIVGTIANTVAKYFFSESSFGYFIMILLITAPAYIPLYNHLIKMIKNSRLSKKITAEKT